jgi:hypothetical protein
MCVSPKDVIMKWSARDHHMSDHVSPGVRAGASNVSIPGAVAFFLDRPPARPPCPMCSVASGAMSTPATMAACT